MCFSVCTLLAAGLAITTVSPPDRIGPPDEARFQIEQALASLSQVPPACADVRRGLVAILDAVGRLSDLGDERHHACGARAAVASIRLARGSLLDPAAVALIQECHRILHHDTSFMVPDGVRNPAEATQFIAARLEQARRLLSGPRPCEATDALLDAALMIVTPIER